MTPPLATPPSDQPPEGVAVARFLARHGWGGADVAPMAGDASFRRYARVSDRGRTAILMEAPPDKEDTRPFIFVAELLLANGFRAPRLLAADVDAGLLLLEDFGDRLMAKELAAARVDEESIYGQAVDLLATLHRLPPPPELKPYGRDELLREVMLFPEWYMAATGLAADVAGYAAAWDDAWQGVLQETLAEPVVVLRDYHAENLMLLGDAPGARLGLLDFQDALAGHRAYDLVSLLQDARRDVPPRLQAAMLQRFIDATEISDEEGFRASYDVLGAQRNAKILGIFVRLRDRDGRQGYVERLPRVWRHLERNLAHPALASVRAWFDAHVPPEARAPWCADKA
ncbi:aminoglycoside phosphotransferase family protein [Thermaurantiacus sp.]